VTDSVSHLQPRVPCCSRAPAQLPHGEHLFLQVMLAIVIDAPASDLGSAVDLVAPGGTGKADEFAAPGGTRVSGELWAVGRAVTAAANLTTDGKRCSPVQLIFCLSISHPLSSLTFRCWLLHTPPALPSAPSPAACWFVTSLWLLYWGSGA
jgi:hypothetical protein